jgi:MFS family permease
MDMESLNGGPSPQRLFMLILVTVTAALLYADQNLLAPNLSAISHSFGMTELQRDRLLGGAIAAAFYLVGAPAALLFGWLSDRVNRCHLLFAAVMLGERQPVRLWHKPCEWPTLHLGSSVRMPASGEAPTILTIFVRAYWQLFVLRLLTGIALGGALPVVFSLLGDLYEPSQRAAVSGVVQLSTGMGLALGQGIAGFVGKFRLLLPMVNPSCRQLWALPS